MVIVQSLNQILNFKDLNKSKKFLKKSWIIAQIFPKGTYQQAKCITTNYTKTNDANLCQSHETQSIWK